MPAAIDDPGFTHRINALFGNRTMFLLPLAREPVLHCLGDFVPAPELSPRIAYWRDFLSQDGRYNEMQGILADEIKPRACGEVTIPYRALDYATARAIRETGAAPPILSVGTLGVCLEKRTLYVHKRTSGAPDNAGMLHSFSGGYCIKDGDGVIAEGLREFSEETGLGDYTPPPGTPPPRLALFRDNDYGALETCLLGVPLSPAQVARMMPTAEGYAYEIAFDDLPGSLIDGSDIWTEGGKLEVLTWLAMNAPPGPPNARFANMTALDLFRAATN